MHKPVCNDELRACVQRDMTDLHPVLLSPGRYKSTASSSLSHNSTSNEKRHRCFTLWTRELQLLRKMDPCECTKSKLNRKLSLVLMFGLVLFWDQLSYIFLKLDLFSYFQLEPAAVLNPAPAQTAPAPPARRVSHITSILRPVVDEVHRPRTWVEVEIPSVKYYSSKSESAPFKCRLE